MGIYGDGERWGEMGEMGRDGEERGEGDSI